MYFSKKLAARADYYKALTACINHISSEVKFRQNPIKMVVESFMRLGETPLSKNLAEYLTAFDPTLLQLSKGVLKEKESMEVQKFFGSLGSLDSDTQVFELETYQEKFERIAQETAEKRSKYSALYIKLGFFIGLAAGILLL